jgi:hypothetical protein
MSVFNGWKDFQEFIDVANRNCNWLVLRNFEFLPNDFFGNDTDVDVLCENLELFTTTMKLTKRSWGVGAYETIIDGKLVPFDVRFLGDGYYDKLWQYNMLKNKIFTSFNVPRMNNEDYFYSLIYHSKLQKYKVKPIYTNRFKELAHLLNIDEYEKSLINNDDYIANLLSNFMKDKYYNFSVPVDINIPENKAFLNRLDQGVLHGFIFKTPAKIKILRLIPKSILRISPRLLKDGIKKVLKWN